MNFKLTNPPEDERSKELWMQHAAGFMVFENIRKYAVSKISIDVDCSTRSQIIKGIDDTIYGLMMQMDVFFIPLENDSYRLELQTIIQLYKDNELIQSLDTKEGDGMCMGYHDWMDGDFGADDIVIKNV